MIRIYKQIAKSLSGKLFIIQSLLRNVGLKARKIIPFKEFVPSRMRRALHSSLITDALKKTQARTEIEAANAAIPRATEDSVKLFVLVDQGPGALCSNFSYPQSSTS